jgi:predicted Na+-dependent transporter
VKQTFLGLCFLSWAVCLAQLLYFDSERRVAVAEILFSQACFFGCVFLEKRARRWQNCTVEKKRTRKWSGSGITIEARF